MRPSLPKSYKRAFPFSIGSTSFIYPDHVIPNVELLGPCLDEIEIILFESAEESLPSKDNINTLMRLAGELELTYNIHLPIDVSVTGLSEDANAAAVEKLIRVADLTLPLSPTTWTLHLPFDKRMGDDHQRWLDNALKNTQKFLTAGMDPKSVSIETLDYPFEWAEPVADELGCSVCIDLGHLFRFGFDAKNVFDRNAERTSIIHLHGVEGGRDHVSLGRLGPGHSAVAADILEHFEGVVSIEVFSFDNLRDSLETLEKMEKSD